MGNILIRHTNIPTPAKRHGPLIPARRRDEEVVLVDLEGGVA